MLDIKIDSMNLFSLSYPYKTKVKVEK